MDLRLQLLESFTATGSDGTTYKVCAYDRMVPDLAFADGGEHWESSGMVEYRLDDGRPVDVQRDDTARIHGTDVVLDMSAPATLH